MERKHGPTSAPTVTAKGLTWAFIDGKAARKRNFSSTCWSGHVIVGSPKEKNVRHNCFGLRGVWSDGDASSGHAGSGASLPRMCAKGEKRGQTSSSRKEVGRAKSNPRTRVVGFVGPIC